jgi:hypothetical protein
MIASFIFETSDDREPWELAETQASKLKCCGKEANIDFFETCVMKKTSCILLTLCKEGKYYKEFF